MEFLNNKTMKEETLEEAAERYSEELLEAKTIQPHEKTWIKSMFIYVAKWQAERMYSEEDIRNAIDFGANLGLEGDIGNSFEWTRKKDLWFEQFKKK
jgi:hypothetical protein